MCVFAQCLKSLTFEILHKALPGDVMALIPVKINLHCLEPLPFTRCAEVSTPREDLKDGYFLVSLIQ